MSSMCEGGTTCNGTLFHKVMMQTVPSFQTRVGRVSSDCIALLVIAEDMRHEQNVHFLDLDQMGHEAVNQRAVVQFEVEHIVFRIATHHEKAADVEPDERPLARAPRELEAAEIQVNRSPRFNDETHVDAEADLVVVLGRAE